LYCFLIYKNVFGLEGTSFEGIQIIGYEINQACVKLTITKLLQDLSHVNSASIKADIKFADILKLQSIDKSGSILFGNLALLECALTKCMWLGLDKEDGPSRFFITDYESNGKAVLSFIMKVRPLRMIVSIFCKILTFTNLIARFMNLKPI